MNNDLKIIDSIEDLSKSKIGVYTGSEYDTLLKEKISDAKPAYYNSYSDEISALKSGKIDAFLTDEPLAKEILKNTKSGISSISQGSQSISYDSTVQAFKVNESVKALLPKPSIRLF